MKIVKKVINKKKKVFAVKFQVEANTDDLWNIYNLLAIGDLVQGTVQRRVKFEGGGLTRTENKKFNCTLKVVSFQYDAENDSLRIKGTNATENRHIGLN